MIAARSVLAPPPSSARGPATRRDGMTLVEMLVSTVITLILIGLVAQLFGMLGSGVTASRSLLETNDQLRSVAHKLRTDLAGITVAPLPPLRPEAANGYMEIIEGDGSDTSAGVMGLVGDCDDVLLFTTRSLGDPFVGRFGSAGLLESPTAEVAWYCVQAGSVSGVSLYSLYRRQLLVTGMVGTGPFATSGSNAISGSLPGAYVIYDLSLRVEPDGRIYPNSLADVTKRENRFLHNTSVTGSFPYAFPVLSGTTNGLVFDSASGRQGEDLLLTNVIAFDVRVFDPYAPIRLDVNDRAMTPGDPGYDGEGPTSPATYGAYIDLGSSPGLTALTGSAAARSQLARTYDTWSLHYEFNGLDDDDDGVIDEGSDGADSNGNDIVDDTAEYETAPPYGAALRGIEIRIRCYEPSSRQIRQVTVRHTFVPH
jgi:hypothetical protein